jgi:diacylglycerol kinase (ATP)
MTEDAMWLLAINPTSGRGKGASIGQKVANYLNERSIRYQIVTGANPFQFQENLKREATSANGIIAVGGDGLIHMSLQISVRNNIPLSTVPAGTGNDFVRTLGWNPTKPLEPLWTALNRDPDDVDLGSIDGEFFGAIASTGFDSIVNERANSMKWPKGPSKYNVAMALELPKFKPRNYRFTIDGKTFEREAMLIAAGNGRSYGGGMMVCPSADIQDGLLDLMILNPVSKREFVQIFPSVYEGKHVEHPQVEVMQGREIYIDADAICYADGERIGPMPANISVAEGVLKTWRN